MREAGGPSTGSYGRSQHSAVPVLPGVVMVASPEVLRNASGAQSEGPEPATGGAVRELRPYDRSRCAEHGGLLACFPRCARPTGGSHGRITRGPAQRFKEAKRWPRRE